MRGGSSGRQIRDSEGTEGGMAEAPPSQRGLPGSVSPGASPGRMIRRAGKARKAIAGKAWTVRRRAVRQRGAGRRRPPRGPLRVQPFAAPLPGRLLNRLLGRAGRAVEQAGGQMVHVLAGHDVADEGSAEGGDAEHQSEHGRKLLRSGPVEKALRHPPPGTTSREAPAEGRSPFRSVGHPQARRQAVRVERAHHDLSGDIAAGERRENSNEHDFKHGMTSWLGRSDPACELSIKMLRCGASFKHKRGILTRCS